RRPRQVARKAVWRQRPVGKLWKADRHAALEGGLSDGGVGRREELLGSAGRNPGGHLRADRLDRGACATRRLDHEWLAHRRPIPMATSIAAAPTPSSSTTRGTAKRSHSS